MPYVKISTMKFKKHLVFIAALLSNGSLFSAHANPPFEARLEGGVFRTISNRFNIPNPPGSRVSLKDTSANFYGRAEGFIPLSERGYLRVLVAPLNADYTFTPTNSFLFNGRTFAANTPLKVDYRFNSYRLGYLYRLPITETFRVQFGGTAKIRQARIRVTSANAESSYDNVGFVPLLSLGLAWKFYGPLSLRLEADGAAAKQGRAVDASGEIFYQSSETGSGISLGARLLEGGADNEKVNTFALVNYGFLAWTQIF